VVSGQ